MQPEAAADLLDTGITLIGGGALQFGLAECFSRELPEIPILTAKNAVTAVADGMNAVIFKKESRENIGSSLSKGLPMFVLSYII